MNASKLLDSDIAKSVLPLGILGAAVLLWQVGALTGTPGEIMDDVRNDGPNEVAVDQMVQNYYEQVLDFDRTAFSNAGAVGDALGQIQQDVPEGWDRLQESAAMRDLKDQFLLFEFVPGASVEHKGVTVAVNRWGMRDKDREQTKPPGSFRIALVGSSNSMGSGVEMNQCYAALLEERLNKELGGKAFQAYEVLNFSVNGYHLLERVYMNDQRVPAFQPDLILCEANVRDVRRYVHERLARRVHGGNDLHFDYLKKVVAQAKLNPADPENKIESQLARFRRELVTESFRELSDISKRTQIPIAIVALRLDTGPIHKDLEWTAETAEEYLPVIRLFDAYNGQKPDEMYLSDMDRHPTPKGHALFADELFDDLMKDPRWGPMIRGESAASGS